MGDRMGYTPRRAIARHSPPRSTPCSARTGATLDTLLLNEALHLRPLRKACDLSMDLRK